MNGLKKIFYLSAALIFLLCSCFRIDRGQDTELKSSDGFYNKAEITKERNQSKYKKPANLYCSGVDYRLSRMPAGQRGGQIAVSTSGSGIETFNPWVSKDASSSQAADMLYDSLFGTDPDTGEVIPVLAESMTVSDDLKTYTVKLRRGVKWSDGREITADDAVFTWNDIILAGFGNTSARDALLIDGSYPEIKKIDKYTIQFKIKKPFAPFQRMLGFQPAPMHIFKDVVKKGHRYFDSYMNASVKPDSIVSSGAFMLEEYIPAQRIVFKRNPDYYVMDDKKNLLPYIDKYIIVIAGDSNNEMLKFEAGEIDAVPVRGKDLARFKAAEKKSDFKLYNLGPSTGTMFLAFNLSTSRDKNGRPRVNPVKQLWFNDLNFRTALDYAIDRNAMVYNTASGAAQPLFTAESLPSIYLNEKLAAGHERNIEYAEQLLKQSGFYKDKKGQLFDKFGNAVIFDLYTNAGHAEREACGVMIKEDAAELGIKINFKPVEFNSLVSKITNSSDWDTVIIGLTGSAIEPHSGKNVWYSKGHLHLFNMRHENDANDTVLDWEKELDEIIEKGALELEFNKRKVYYDRYQEIIYNQRPVIYLYSPLSVTAVRRKIKNLHPSPLTGIFHNIEELYIDNDWQKSNK